MSKAISLIAALSISALAFSACSDEPECSKDDTQCIAECQASCVKKNCGEKTLGDTTLNEGIDYAACLAKVATDNKCPASACTE